MKIIAGIHKGYRLPSPKGSHVRPTQEKVRAQIFNICQNDIEDANVLDLFAGSGSLGFEALSRGAKSCTFVESDFHQAALIRQVIQDLKVEADVLVMDARRAIELLNKRGSQFSLCLLDPPYSQTNPQNSIVVTETIQALDSNKILKSDCRVFLEDSFKGDVDLLPLVHLKLVDARRSGDTCLREYVFNS